MVDDQQLLRRYVDEGSEAAFGELVARHVNMVYSAALRRTGGDAHLAQDVAQLVFTDLARKAPSLSSDVVLPGWLHRASRYAAAQLVRTERRRQAREQEAVAMHELETENAPHWEDIRPLLDEALDDLNQADRDALLLRFFGQRNIAEVGLALGANEEATRKRVSRALEKLREYMMRRGVTTTTAALSATLAANAVQAAPTGLAVSLAAASLTGAAKGTGTTFTLLKLMASTKLKTALVGLVMVSAVVTPLVIQHQAQARVTELDASLRQQTSELTALRIEHDRLAKLAALGSQANNPEELERLRAEAAALQKLAGELKSVRDEDDRLKETLRRTRQGPAKVNEQPAVWTKEAMEKSSYSRNLGLALFEYASKHREEFSTNFADVVPFFSDEVKGQTNYSPELFEIVYQGSRNALTNYAHPGDILLLRERKPWKNTDGQWVKLYVFTDGHGQVHSESEGNFEAWENKRILAPQPPQP